MIRADNIPAPPGGHDSQGRLEWWGRTWGLDLREIAQGVHDRAPHPDARLAQLLLDAQPPVLVLDLQSREGIAPRD